MGVGPEVPGALALGPAHHLRPGKLLPQRHGEVGVGLVVAVLDVEPRVVLLDPGVLELQGLHLGRDHGPLDAGGGGDHGGRARVQLGDVLEVRREPRTQRLGLADVDDPLGGIPEPVDARVDRDLPRRRTVGRRVSHDSTLWRATDGTSRGRSGGPPRRGMPRGDHTAYLVCVLGRDGQVIEIPSPVTDTDFSGSALVAGPFFTAPVVMSNSLPWQAQLMVPFSTPLTRHAWWVQTALKALNCPDVGWVTTTFWSPKTFPPPTGIVAFEIASLTPLVAA